ncbi:MAG TPA: flagellar biosynthetic protein FliO [Steroidobacteraceae bacterium]|nr:flagellar biosynthetic protein FliO [Steroidobacteraceae bacterium]
MRLASITVATLSVCVAPICSAAEKLFAAPESSGPAGQSAGASLGQMTLALAVVLIVVFAAAWMLKQTRKFTTKGGHGIEVLAQVALGAKERAVLLKVGTVHVLVGVAPGQVNALHVDTAPIAIEVAAPTEPAHPTHSFQAILKRSLGL